MISDNAPRLRACEVAVEGDCCVAECAVLIAAFQSPIVILFEEDRYFVVASHVVKKGPVSLCRTWIRDINIFLTLIVSPCGPTIVFGTQIVQPFASWSVFEDPMNQSMWSSLNARSCKSASLICWHRCADAYCRAAIAALRRWSAHLVWTKELSHQVIQAFTSLNLR